MRLIDLLNKIADGTLEDGFKFIFKYDNSVYQYEKEFNTIEATDGSKFWDNYNLGNCLNDEIEGVSETEEIEEIEELNEHEYTGYYTSGDVEINRKAINELIRTVNKLIRQSE